MDCNYMYKKLNINSLLISLLIFISCTKVIEVEDNRPVIDSIIMSDIIELSISDTTWHEINLYISDRDGVDDIENVIFSVRRDSIYEGSVSNTGECQYDLVLEEQFTDIVSYPLLYTFCTGNTDSNLLKVCEELSESDCQSSNECILNSNESEFLYYTFIPFRPLMEDLDQDGNLDGCGGYGKMSFKFLVTDLSGNQFLSDIKELEVCGWECVE